MWSQQVFVAFLSACLSLQHVAAVVNNGQTKKIEESPKTTSENQENEKINTDTGDLVAESSETSNRREAPAIHDTYGVPSLGSSGSGHISLPVPVYGVPNAPSNNIVYPAPPPDIPPPPPKILPGPLYGAPTLGKTYGVPQVNHLPPISKGYGAPLPIKYGAPSFSYNKFSSNHFSPPKSNYGPPYSPPGKPLKYHKYPPKNFGFRAPKPVYGTPIAFKDNFNYNKLNLNNNHLNNNNLYTGNLFGNNAFSTNSFSNLYSGVSSLNHQYGAPILPPKQTISIEYGSPNVGLSSQYGVPDKSIASGPPLAAYGPPQPSPNPRPPHPGAPAPPTPPDIKYDGWQPIPGLVSKRPVEEVHHLTAEGSGYHDLSPPSLNIGHNQPSNSYGAPAVTLDITHGNSLLDKPGLSDSYGVALNAVTGSNGVSDSYSAPLGTVTGSGGIVASSGSEAHGAGSLSHSNSQGSSHSLTLDLSSIGVGHGSDTKDIEYDIHLEGGSGGNGEPIVEISNSYGAPQASSFSLGNSYASGQSYNNIGSSSHSYKGGFGGHGHKNSLFSGASIGLVPPSGVYGAPPSSQYGTPLYTNSHGNYKGSGRQGLYTNVQQANIGKGSFNRDVHHYSGSSGGNSYLPPSPPIPPSSSYGVPSGSGAISYQNVAHGSATAGIELQHSTLNFEGANDLQHSTLNIEGANALPLTSYNAPLGAVDGSYTLPSASNGDISVSIDYSHPPLTIDLTEGKLAHDCHNKQQLQVPSLAYGVPSADSYSSSLSSLTTNIANSHAQTIVPQSSYGAPDLVAPQSQISVPSSQYGVQDLLHSSSIKTEAKVNSLIESEATHGKNYGQSVAASFGPNSELVESHSIDLNNIPLQGNLGSYTLQIQSADGTGGQVPHTQVFNEGLLQSILQAIEQPGKQGQNTKYPIILQPSVERDNYSINETVSGLDESHHQASEIREVIVEAPKDNQLDGKTDNPDNEETLQLLDTSNIALYYRKEDDVKEVNAEEKSNENNSVDNEST